MEKFFKHPWVIICVIAAITIFFALQLPRAHMDNNISAWLPVDNQAKVISRHLEAKYGDEIMIMVGLERPYGTVFDSAFLSRIRDFNDAVENIELVKDTNSLMSSQYITSDSESIIVTDLVSDDFSGTPEEIAELKRRIASWDMYDGALVSADLSSTQIMIKINASSDESGNPEIAALLIQIRDMAKEMFADYATVYTAGQPVVAAIMGEAALTDISGLVPLVIVVLLIILFISFRRISYVMLPLMSVVVSTIWAIGAMPLCGISLSILCMILPIILIAVGSAYAIHVVSHYKDEIHEKTFTVEEHRDFVLHLVAKMIKPVALAALTTFAGFISFVLAPLNPIRDFGIFASLGVLAAFAVSITLIPAILLLRGERATKLAAQREAKRNERVKKTYFDFENELATTLGGVTKKKTLVLVITALVIIVSIVGATKVVVDSAMIEMFKEKSEVSRSDRFIREYFGGSSQLFMSVEADDTQTLLQSDVLAAIDGLSSYLIERIPTVTRVSGFTNLIKRMNQLFNVDESPDGITQATNFSGNSDLSFGDFGFNDFEEEDNALEFAPQTITQSTMRILPPPASSDNSITFAMLNSAAGKRTNMNANDLVKELERMTNYEGYSYYEIPQDPVRYGKTTADELQQLVSNYLVLLAGKSDDGMSNDPLEPTAIKTIILINNHSQREAQNIVKIVNDYVAANFPKTVRVVIGGMVTKEGAVATLVTHSQIISMLVSLLIVLIIVALSYKSLAAGVIAAIPLSLSILANFAMMGFLHVNINVATALLSSLTVGIGIDYTIHFIDAFKRECQEGGDYLFRTFAGAGKAILINAISVGAGIGVLAFSQIRVITQFGGLIAISMCISALASLTVIPVLLTTVKPKFIYGNNSISC